MPAKCEYNLSLSPEKCGLGVEVEDRCDILLGHKYLCPLHKQVVRRALLAIAELDVLKVCHDCGAKPGEVHKDGCDTELCSVCGGQRLQCDCKGHDKGFARWTGLWPGSAEAKLLGADLNTLHAKHRAVFFVKPKTKIEVRLRKDRSYE